MKKFEGIELTVPREIICNNLAKIGELFVCRRQRLSSKDGKNILSAFLYGLVSYVPWLEMAVCRHGLADLQAGGGQGPEVRPAVS